MHTDLHGLPTRALTNGHIRLDVLTTAGPRIVHMSLLPASENLMAEVPDIKIPTPLGDFNLFGGHRLWHSPEAFPRSYLPDNDPPEITATADSLQLTQAIEPMTGIQKSIEIRLGDEVAAATVIHRLANHGAWPVELAAWALTQMRLGGLAVLPQTAHALDGAGLLPNRNVVLWPYTRWSDPRLRMDDDLVLLSADALQPPCKIGYFNRHGWLGYLAAGVFFVKRFQVFPALSHPDFGCNSETYCNDRFIEIETVGPLARIEPGQTVTHVEEWELHAAADAPQTAAGIRELVKQLGLPIG